MRRFESNLLAIAASVLAATALATSVRAEEGSFDVLAYHDVRDVVSGDYDADQYAISTGNLIDHFTWLRINGFVPVSVDDLLEARAGRKPLPDKAVLLTFDDGFESVYTHVLPLLELFDYPAVVSIVTDWIENDAGVAQGGRILDHEDFMTWSEIRELADSGRVEIASHSHNLHVGIQGNPQGNLQPAAVTLRYRDGTYESEAENLARVESDLVKSARLIEEHTGSAPRVITWPYGAYNERIRRVADRHGMPISLTLTDGTNSVSDLGVLARHLIRANPGVEELAYALLHRPAPPIVRAAQVDLDYVYDEDPEQQERNLGYLLDRIKALEITHVFLQAYADPDADGGAQSLYFPNRRLPMRADLFNRAAWQLKTRANVLVYAWLPLLSFEGASIDPAWRVQQTIEGRTGPDPESEPRLSPFSPQAIEVVRDIYHDLGTHASFDGILFHDDGRLNEFEDTSPAAMQAYEQAFGETFSIERLGEDPALRERWSRLRSKRLIDLSRELTRAVRESRPEAKTARNIFSGALLDDDARLNLAQDYGEFLEAYDYVALMAMPALEGVADPDAYYRALATATRHARDGRRKTIFELQTVDWRTGAPIPDVEIEETMRRLQSLGIRHLAYYPDDFVNGHPDLDKLRQGMSIAVFPRGAAR